MLLTLLVCQVALTIANPFHKYPYVFLLDIGNEELDKTNMEQIRVSMPGGSLALRYPAIGDGDTISHVRVSGIDFGSDIKASIIDGGPGYKYVVIVFMSNPGVQYDAVMTIQTVSDNSDNSSGGGNGPDSNNNSVDDDNDSSEITDNVMNNETDKTLDENNSAEDTSDLKGDQNVKSKNAEVTQESSNIYNYLKSVSANENEDTKNEGENIAENESENDDDVDEKDIHTQYSMNPQDQSLKDYDEDNDVEDQNIQDTSNFNQNEGQDLENNDESDKYSQTGSISYTPYSALRPILFGGVRVYPQNRVPFVFRENNNIGYNPENTLKFDKFTEKEEHNALEKIKESNNNYMDTNGDSAVAY